MAQRKTTRRAGPSRALAMLRDLLQPDELAARLEATAPAAVAAEGGGAALVALYGAPTGATFWLLRPMPEGLWCAMASEAQERHRVNAGE
jgi:hypothetical protein